jgi:drug/metabolite transporter (DMT)-like permease
MFPAALAATFFALNVTFARQSVRGLGMLNANLARLVVGVLVLGVFAHTWGTGLRGAGTSWFLLSGLVGLGIGDIGSYAALPILGSRLTILMVQCVAAPIAALGEWLWLGTTLTGAQIACGIAILAGVALALAPGRREAGAHHPTPFGLAMGLVGALGQGLGAAVISRKGVMMAAQAGENVRTATFGMTAAYERLVAGLAFTLVWYLAARALGKVTLPEASGRGRAPLLWTLGNGLAGPVAGVGCYQWALATTKSGIVLPIVALAPLISVPIAFALEGDRPNRRSLVGGAIAVAATILLMRTGAH